MIYTHFYFSNAHFQQLRQWPISIWHMLLIMCDDVLLIANSSGSHIVPSIMSQMCAAREQKSHQHELIINYPCMMERHVFRMRSDTAWNRCPWKKEKNVTITNVWVYFYILSTDRSVNMIRLLHWRRTWASYSLFYMSPSPQVFPPASLVYTPAVAAVNQTRSDMLIGMVTRVWPASKSLFIGVRHVLRPALSVIEPEESKIDTTLSLSISASGFILTSLLFVTPRLLNL